MDDFKVTENMLRKNRENQKAQERLDKAEAYNLLHSDVIEISPENIRVVDDNKTDNNRSNARFTTKKGSMQAKKNNLSKSARLAIAAFAAAAGILFTVKFFVPKSPEIDTANLKNISTSDLDDLALDSNEMQELMSFADNFDLSISRESLAKNYDKYYEICGNVLKSKVSNITGVSKDEICVVKDNDEYKIVKGYINDSGLVVSQGTLLSNDEIPDSMRNIVSDYVAAVDLHRENVPFSISSDSQLKKRNNRLKNSIIELVNFAGDELIYDGQSYSLAQVDRAHGVSREKPNNEKEDYER